MRLCNYVEVVSLVLWFVSLVSSVRCLFVGRITDISLDFSCACISGNLTFFVFFVGFPI